MNAEQIRHQINESVQFRTEIEITHLLSQEERQILSDLQDVYNNLTPVVIPYTPIEPLDVLICKQHM